MENLENQVDSQITQESQDQPAPEAQAQPTENLDWNKDKRKGVLWKSENDLYKSYREMEKMQSPLKSELNTIKESFKKFIKDYPFIKKLVVTGSTPSFNDGDPCTFSLHEFQIFLDLKKADKAIVEAIKAEFHLSDEDLEMAEDEDFAEENEYNGDLGILEDMKSSLPEEYRNMLRELTKLESDCNSIEDLMQSTFGSNFKLVITSKGIDVQDYDCGY